MEHQDEPKEEGREGAVGGSEGVIHEDELKARFRAMKSEEGRAAPPFSAPSAPRRSVRVVVPAAAAAMLIIAIAAAWLLVREPADQDRRAFLQLDRTEWVAPTDFLLDIGNRSLLSSMPAIGEIHGRAAGGSENRERQDTLNTEGRRS